MRQILFVCQCWQKHSIGSSNTRLDNTNINLLLNEESFRVSYALSCKLAAHPHAVTNLSLANRTVNARVKKRVFLIIVLLFIFDNFNDNYMRSMRKLFYISNMQSGGNNNSNNTTINDNNHSNYKRNQSRLSEKINEKSDKNEVILRLSTHIFIHINKMIKYINRKAKVPVSLLLSP